LIAVLVLCVGCETVTPVPQASVATSLGQPMGSCEPTFAHMIPPQAVMDIMIGGASPRPSPVPSREVWAATGNWVGNSAMWIGLPLDGVFQRRYSKIWMVPLKGGPITVSGKQVDGDGRGTFTGTASEGNIGSSVTFSTIGCWELVYRLAGEELRFTMRVED